MTRFAESLDRWMKERGFSQAELGRCLRTPGKPKGITGEAVGNWLRGARPTQVPAEVIAAALTLPVADVRRALGQDAEEPRQLTHRAQQEARLTRVLVAISGDDLDYLCAFAEFLAARNEREAWRQFALEKLSRAYGEDEPEYTLADTRA